MADDGVKKMKRSLACALALLLLSVVLLSSGIEAGTDEGRYFRVVSFNIRYNNPADGENAWPKRKEMVAALIRFHRADLAGVQEALEDQIDDLEKLLPRFGWCGVGRDDGKSKGEFSAIFYNKDRFDLLESANFWLSETPDAPGSRGWDAALPRIVTWARFKDKATSKIFFHFNTHFDHRGERARTESARLLLARIEKIAARHPVVVTGDFNFNESADGYGVLTGKKSDNPALALRDARYISAQGHYGPTSTFNGFKALVPDSKIDFILVKGRVRVLRHGILSDTWDGRFPSDHLPVLAEAVIE